MSIYINVYMSDGGPSLTVSKSEFKDFVEQVCDESECSGDMDSYTFTTVEMSEQEFNDLPEFQGF